MTSQRKKSFFDMQFVTATISTTMVLLLLGLVMFSVLCAHNLSTYVKENIIFSIVISDDMKENDILALQRQLDAKPFVRTSAYISKKQALKEYTEAMGTDPQEFLGHNPFTASLQIKLNSDYANTDSLAIIEKQIKGNTNIQDVIYQRDLIDAVNDNIARISLLLLALAAVLTLISFALINNTIRLTIYSKRFLIHTMKLVGATGAFIRKPFLMQGAVTGLIAAILAMGLLSGILFVLRTEISQLLSIESMNALLVSFIVMLISGVAITTFATYLSVTRYLRLRIDDMYYI